MDRRTSEAAGHVPPTQEVVLAAIKSLRAVDLDRLDRYARMKARALAALGLGVSGDDLLQVAMERTARGSRKWNKRVTFVQHLMGVVRSHASHLARKGAGVVLVNADPPAYEDAEAEQGYVHLRSRTPDPERAMMAPLKLESIRKRFAEDEPVLNVMDDLMDGLSGPEIKKKRSISQTAYETIMKRLRRGVDKMEKEERNK